jgi:hypothetical protein
MTTVITTSSSGLVIDKQRLSALVRLKAGQNRIQLEGVFTDYGWHKHDKTHVIVDTLCCPEAANMQNRVFLLPMMESPEMSSLKQYVEPVNVEGELGGDSQTTDYMRKIAFGFTVKETEKTTLACIEMGTYDGYMLIEKCLKRLNKLQDDYGIIGFVFKPLLLTKPREDGLYDATVIFTPIVKNLSPYDLSGLNGLVTPLEP